MPNTLKVTGNTRLTWSLSDGENSRSDQRKIGRSISNGTGPEKANFAYSTTISLATGSSTTTLSGFSLPTEAYGFQGSAFCQKVKEVLVEVVSGPTGGYVIFQAPHIPGTKVGTGGQLHVVDYQLGVTGTGDYSFTASPTGPYSVAFSLIGEGYYENI